MSNKLQDIFFPLTDEVKKLLYPYDTFENLILNTPTLLYDTPNNINYNQLLNFNTIFNNPRNDMQNLFELEIL